MGSFINVRFSLDELGQLLDLIEAGEDHDVGMSDLQRHIYLRLQEEYTAGALKDGSIQ